MIIFFALTITVLVGLIIFALLKADKAEKLVTLRDRQIVEADQRVLQANERLASESARIHSEAQSALALAQRKVAAQLEEMAQESASVRQHFESEARTIQIQADASLARRTIEFEALKKYEVIKDAESEIKRMLSEAISESAALRTEGNVLLQQTRSMATNERQTAIQKVKDIHEQADARLNQALRDSGRIVADAEKRAEKIAGSAYTALRDKELLENAAQAMRNIIEGYGDQYLVPTHSLLDDLAAEYGYDAAGQSLASARDQSKRMVEQRLAADCDYVEEARRISAIQFVIHAFNGSVDAILSRTKRDNFGTLEQMIRDCFSIVNRDGSAFRNARILPTYLDARLAELKWAVIVQELAQRVREEQRKLKEDERDRQLAEQDDKEKREKELRDAMEQTERIRVQLEEQKKGEASQEVILELQRRLAESQEKEAIAKQPTIAQRTDKGRIYIISNVGSFGHGVFKIGLTRRLVEVRIDELGSASVPFEFDIHAVVETENVLALEYKIHQQILATRINKINLRKEFFRISLTEIREVVEKLEHGKDFHGTITWTEKARAEHYYETCNIDSDADSKEKWLTRTRQIAERRKRAAPRMLVTIGE